METHNKLNEIKVDYTLRTHYDIQVTDSKISDLIARRIYNESGANMELKEYFFIMLLNRSNHIIGWHKLSEGGITGTIADIKLAFSSAIKCLASGIILMHNHPSGACKPSIADKELTLKFKKAGELLDVYIMDHLVVTKEDYFSFADHGEL